jgi:hypothetical protein
MDRGRSQRSHTLVRRSIVTSLGFEFKTVSSWSVLLCGSTSQIGEDFTMHQQGERYRIPYQKQKREHAKVWQIVFVSHRRFH